MVIQSGTQRSIFHTTFIFQLLKQVCTWCIFNVPVHRNKSGNVACVYITNKNQHNKNVWCAHYFIIKMNIISIIYFVFLTKQLSRLLGLPEQMTPASSPWPQLCSPHPLDLQFFSVDSDPLQATLSIQICPDPGPKWATLRASTASPQSSSLHTTLASVLSQL